MRRIGTSTKRGLIGLFGIAVQNGLVLVTQTRALVDSGRPFEEALREACVGRVRLTHNGRDRDPRFAAIARASFARHRSRTSAGYRNGRWPLDLDGFHAARAPTFYSLVHPLRQKRKGRAPLVSAEQAP